MESHSKAIAWDCKPFLALSSLELHRCLALRCAVFVVEQRCPYQEADYKDEHSLHVMGWQDNELVAYARIVAPGISYKEVSLGRVATVYALRGVGIGKLLMKETMRMILEHYGDVPVRISAQSYLQRFYESFGFACIGQEYQEDDIPHIEMLRRPLLGA